MGGPRTDRTGLDRGAGWGMGKPVGRKGAYCGLDAGARIPDGDLCHVSEPAGTGRRTKRVQRMGDAGKVVVVEVWRFRSGDRILDLSLLHQGIARHTRPPGVIVGVIQARGCDID